MNVVTLNGRLARDPQLVSSNAGARANFTLAVDIPGKKDECYFIPCVAWNKTAEALCRYTESGGRVLVTGALRTFSYEKEGRKIHGMEVSAKHIDFIDYKKKVQADEPVQQQAPSAPQEADPYGYPDYLDNAELPF